MRIFNSEKTSIEETVKQFIGPGKLGPLGVRKNCEKGGLIILHPTRESVYIENSKYWLTVFKISRNTDIDYVKLDEMITKQHGVEHIDVYKNVDEAFTVSHGGGAGISWPRGSNDIIVVRAAGW